MKTNFFSWLERIEKAHLWFVAVLISVLLTEIIVSMMAILLKGGVTADYLLTGLVASAFVATFVVGMVGYFLERLSFVEQDNEYLSNVILKGKQVEQVLRDSDEAYHSIIATTQDGFWMLSSEGKLLDVNHRYIEQSGYSREELLNMHIIDLEAVESVKDNAAHIQRVIEKGGDQFESVHRRKDGTFWQVEISVTYRNHNPNGGRFYAFLRNISERKQAEIKLRESEEMLRAITDNTNTIIFIKDLTGQILFVNPLFERLFHVSNMKILGKTNFDIFPQDLADKFTKDDQLVIESGQPLTIEENVPADDGIHTYITVKFPLRNITGKMYAICGIATDITERKKLEEEIRCLSDSELNKAKLEAEKANRAKSEFLSSMSHELRTPMNAVLGFAQLLEAEDLTEDQHDSVEEILAAGQHLLELINDVLDLSKIEAEKVEFTFKSVELNRLIACCIALVQGVAAKYKVTLQDQITPSSAFNVYADELRLKQVLLNLISNAIKYNQVGGSVTLSCELTNPQIIKIKVTDTGKGLSEIQLSKLFQPFERLNAKNSTIEGTGIGLCISKKLIENMKGTIGVDSKEGEGSCFWIEIPLL